MTRALVIAGVVVAAAVAVAQTSAKTFIPFSDARFLFDALRTDLIPAELRDPDREQRWAEWIRRRDAAIRARATEGDEDSHNEWAMSWTLRDGRVAKWQVYEDTARELAAHAPAGV